MIAKSFNLFSDATNNSLEANIVSAFKVLPLSRVNNLLAKSLSFFLSSVAKAFVVSCFCVPLFLNSMSSLNFKDIFCIKFFISSALSILSILKSLNIPS